MEDETQTVAVRFPLSGEYCAFNTPGHTIPSHGTNQLGQRYAFDFFQIDWNQKGYRFYQTSALKSIILGVKLQDTFCWSEPIYAPFNGEVIEVMDGLKERNPVHHIRDLAIAINNGLFLRAKNNKQLHSVLGNFIILKKKKTFIL